MYSRENVFVYRILEFQKTVDEMIKKDSQLSWPLPVDELESKSREPPA